MVTSDTAPLWEIDESAKQHLQLPTSVAGAWLAFKEKTSRDNTLSKGLLNTCFLGHDSGNRHLLDFLRNHLQHDACGQQTL